jgi:hypothetical protein
VWLNLYEYARNSPLVWVDPSGRAPLANVPAEQAVANMAEGLNRLNELADQANAEFCTEEFFLGERAGEYRVFRMASMGGDIPQGWTAVGHTHPDMAMVTHSDVATMRASGVEIGETRVHLVAYGKNRWAILEYRLGESVARMTNLNLQRGVLEGTIDLALAPAGTPLGAKSPMLPGTLRNVGAPLTEANIAEVMATLARRAALARAAGLALAGASVVGMLLLSGLESSPHRGSYGEEEDRDNYYFGQFLCVLWPWCHTDPNDPNAPRLVKEERRAMRQEAILQDFLRAMDESRRPPTPSSSDPAPPSGAGYE